MLQNSKREYLTANSLMQERLKEAWTILTLKKKSIIFLSQIYIFLLLFIYINFTNGESLREEVNPKNYKKDSENYFTVKKLRYLRVT